MKRGLYNLIIGGLLLYGFFMNVLVIEKCKDMVIHEGLVCIGYLVVGFIGVLMLQGDGFGIRFFGYNLICVPSGLVLSIILKDYESINIINAIIAALVITAGMMVISMVIPKVFEEMGNGLLIGLTLGIVVNLFISTTWLNWLFVLLFALYVGYDWVCAQQDEATAENAVSYAANLYLDIVNLFTRLLGDKKE
jgi:FtsH-binding integral membrane protein